MYSVLIIMAKPNLKHFFQFWRNAWLTEANSENVFESFQGTICTAQNVMNTQGLAWFGKSDWDKMWTTIVLDIYLAFSSFQGPIS